jgi:subtilase family serine protease
VLIAPTTTQIALLDNDRADLIVGALTGPAQAATGSPMTVMATVRNQAGGPAPATTLGIFISASSNTPGDGTQVGRVPIPALGSGASFSAVATVNVPAGVPVGQYFLSAVANFNGVAIEDSLANNGFTAPAQLDIVFFK